MPERKPDLLTGTGAMCWISAPRVCGPDCVAFNMETDEHDDHQQRCTVLVVLGQIAPVISQLKPKVHPIEPRPGPDLNPPIPKVSP